MSTAELVACALSSCKECFFPALQLWDILLSMLTRHLCVCVVHGETGMRACHSVMCSVSCLHLSVSFHTCRPWNKTNLL